MGVYFLGARVIFWDYHQNCIDILIAMVWEEWWFVDRRDIKHSEAQFVTATQCIDLSILHYSYESESSRLSLPYRGIVNSVPPYFNI